MKLYAAIAATALIVGSSAAMAETTSTTTTTRTTFAERFAYDSEATEYYRANEFSLDIFGSYYRQQNKWNDMFYEPEGGDWGGGIGMNYFFHKFVGVGVDATVHNNDSAFVDNVNTSVIGRFPIGDSGFAPYIYGGGGHLFDPSDDWSVHAGVGFEFRINPHTGIFIDGRYAWADDESDYSIIRSGFRFAF